MSIVDNTDYGDDACPCAGCKTLLTKDHYRFPVGEGDFLCEDCYELEEWGHRGVSSNTSSTLKP